jgi:hypothetical protein
MKRKQTKAEKRKLAKALAILDELEASIRRRKGLLQ